MTIKLNKTLSQIQQPKSLIKNSKQAEETVFSTKYISDLLKKIRNSKDSDAVLDLLEAELKSEPKLKMRGGVLFQYGDYNIQNFLSRNGTIYEQNLKILKDLHIDSVPQYLETIEKDSELYIVSRLRGQDLGELVPYNRIKHNLSKDAKLSLYNDLQTITKAGYVDDMVANSTEKWYCTQDGKIVLPSWTNLRRISADESQAKIVENYYKLLFT